MREIIAILRGITPKEVQNTAEAFIKAGISGFGIGTTLYLPGQNASETLKKTSVICAAFDKAKENTG